MFRSLVMALIGIFALGSVGAYAAAATPEPLVFEDDADDVGYTVGWHEGPAQPPVAPPAGALEPFLDLRRVMVNESGPTMLEFRVGTEAGVGDGMDVTATPGSLARHWVQFRFPGSDEIAAVQMVTYVGDAWPAVLQYELGWAELCMLQSPEEPGCSQGGTELEYRIVDGDIVLDVPKEYLTSNLPNAGSRTSSDRVAALPDRLLPGDELRDIVAYAFYDEVAVFPVMSTWTGHWDGAATDRSYVLEFGSGGETAWEPTEGETTPEPTDGETASEPNDGNLADGPAREAPTPGAALLLVGASMAVVWAGRRSRQIGRAHV